MVSLKVYVVLLVLVYGEVRVKCGVTVGASEMR